jgi:adenylate kinase
VVESILGQYEEFCVVRLVILGGPGAGKGTQASQLCSRLNIPCISTGEILFKAIAAQTELGRQAQPYAERGELVPDPIMIEFIREQLTQPYTANGWLLDGYPRTAFQAEELDFLLESLQQTLDWAIWLNVSDAELMRRSLQRSQTRPERGRPDDEPRFLQRRIQLFQERTTPILDYYNYGNRLLTLDGDRPSAEIHEEIWKTVNPNKTQS